MSARVRFTHSDGRVCSQYESGWFHRVGSEALASIGSSQTPYLDLCDRPHITFTVEEG